MGIELYAHNREAYEAASAMLERTGRAAVVHPTGTGKSFIAFKYCEDRPRRRICWLSPSEYIFQTQKEGLIAAGGAVPENIVFLTYAKLMLLDGAAIGALQADDIILDEFHRCGAAMWGQGVQRLLAAYPTAPVLGLSATSIRYLDEQRDMAEELFQGNVASEMTLGEAIGRGILASPKYVISVYSYQEELRRYGRRVEQMKNGAARAQAEKYLEALRRALDKADGLDEVFARHMEDRAGKYLVFCANVRHMEELLRCCGEWFRRVDPAPHIYRAWSDDPGTSEAFASFKADRSDHLKLLFCIDMLNEGIHVEGLSGVILFRPTVSPIVYKQQIGRALTASGNREPVIFDVVNNFENLYSIGTIQEELAQAASGRWWNGEGRRLVRDRFQIVDEVRESRRLFQALEETLTAPWEAMFAEAEEYARTHGDLDVPKRYKTEDGFSLGAWIVTQRRVRAGYQYGRLSPEQIAELDSIGMIWEDRLELAWERGYQAAVAYRREHGDLLPVRGYKTGDGYPLGRWLANQRTARSAGKLDPDREGRLDEIGMVWSVTGHLWERNFQAAERFRRRCGHLDVPAAHIEDGVALGAWLRTQRRYRREGRLTEEQIRRLEGLGISWEDKYDRSWERGCRQAERWYADHHDLEVPPTYIDADGFPLGKWLDRHRTVDPRTGRRGIRLTPERRERLDAMGMRWEKKPDPWEVRYELAREFYERHGHLRIPSGYKPQGIWLNKWLNEQKQVCLGRRPGKRLTAEQTAKLEAISFSCRDLIDQAWEEQFAEAEQYFREHGDLQVPAGYIGQNGKRLDLWVARQRVRSRRGMLDRERRERIAAIGIR